MNVKQLIAAYHNLEAFEKVVKSSGENVFLNTDFYKNPEFDFEEEQTKFQKEANKVKDENKDLDENLVFYHVLLHQIARLCNFKKKPFWEDADEMKDLYEQGKLPRWRNSNDEATEKIKKNYKPQTPKQEDQVQLQLPKKFDLKKLNLADDIENYFDEQEKKEKEELQLQKQKQQKKRKKISIASYLRDRDIDVPKIIKGANYIAEKIYGSLENHDEQPEKDYNGMLVFYQDEGKKDVTEFIEKCILEAFFIHAKKNKRKFQEDEQEVQYVHHNKKLKTETPPSQRFSMPSSSSSSSYNSMGNKSFSTSDLINNYGVQNKDENRIYWHQLLDETDVEQRILSNWKGDINKTLDEKKNLLKMKCGLYYKNFLIMEQQKGHKTPPVKIVENRRIYSEEHRAGMLNIISQVYNELGL
jgi:hypothetical protein